MESIINDVSIGVRTKNAKGKTTGYDGVCISFQTNQNIQKGAIVQIYNHPFEVHAINTTDDNYYLNVEAHEVGNIHDHFDRQNNFDIRSLKEQYVTLITDPEHLTKIHAESLWC